MSMEIGPQQDRSTNTDVSIALSMNSFWLAIIFVLYLDMELIDPQNPPDPPLVPFARINQTTGNLVYEREESSIIVFPSPGA